MSLLIDLLQVMSVFLVLGYLFSKSPAFKALTGENLRPRQKAVLYLVFSTFSILGTYFGMPVQDAVANTRAIGAVLAGLLGGPVLGGAVGLTAGVHRYFVGGFVAAPAMVATTTEGLLAGLVHWFLLRKNHADLIYSPRIALGAAFFSQLVHMAIILVMGRPSEEAAALVRVIAVPMITANALGTFLFMSIIRDQKNMVDKLGVLFSAKAFKIAERTLGLLDKGFNRTTAEELSRIIYEESGVGAVGISDCEKVLAFTGIGSDHHRAGNLISSRMALQAIRQNRVIYADGVHDSFICTLSPECSLGSSLVVPLRIDQQVVGTITLFEPKDKLFLGFNKSLGEGIASLLSDQLLRARYEEQKHMLMTTELKLLQAQVNPHFLFNALNTIIAVTRKDPSRARDLLRHLSNFFRKNLKRSGEMSTLEEELDHVNSYLKIENARFEDRLTVEEVIDPDLLSLQMPTFTLQPIIENAIKHGISRLLDHGVVRLTVERVGSCVHISIEDNAGTYEEKPEGAGLGMNIVDRRIKSMFGSQYGVQVRCVPQQSTRVSISLPDKGRLTS